MLHDSATGLETEYTAPPDRAAAPRHGRLSLLGPYEAVRGGDGKLSGGGAGHQHRQHLSIRHPRHHHRSLRQRAGLRRDHLQREVLSGPGQDVPRGVRPLYPFPHGCHPNHRSGRRHHRRTLLYQTQQRRHLSLRLRRVQRSGHRLSEEEFCRRMPLLRPGYHAGESLPHPAGELADTGRHALRRGEEDHVHPPGRGAQQLARL